MSRFLKVMIVLLTIAAMATPVLAEDRLNLAGQFRILGWHIDDGGPSTTTYAEQRFRLGGKLSVAEGVSITFRTDITESNWGSGNTFGSGRTSVGGSDFQSQHWDRAHIDLEKNNMHVRGGQQYIAFGKTGFDTQSNGFAFNYKGDVPVTLFYLLNDNNGSNSVSDAYYAGLRVAHSTDAYGGSLFAVNQNDGMEEKAYMIGGTFQTAMDALKFYAEAEYFFGDANKAAGTDAVGLQLFLDGSIAANETTTVGAQFFYAQGTDDATESQYMLLGDDFGGWDPINIVGTGLDNEDISYGRPFMFSDNSGATSDHTGVILGRIYGMMKASDAVSLGASVAYGVPEEDAATVTVIDSILALTGGISYAVMSNTKLDLQLQYLDVDQPNGDEEFAAGVGLFVNF